MNPYLREQGMTYKALLALAIGLHLAACAALAQTEDSAKRIKQPKNRTYNRRVTWSESPFDSSVTELDDDKPSLFEEEFETFERARLEDTLNSPALFQQPVNSPKPMRTGRPEKTDSSKGLLSGAEEEPDILDTKSDSESDWGWLADAVAEQKRSDSSVEDEQDTEEQEYRQRSSRQFERDRRFTSTAESQRTSQSSYYTDRTSREAASRSTTAAKQQRMNSSPSGEEMQDLDYENENADQTSARSDSLLSAWEKELGLNSSAPESKSTLPTSRELTDRIVNRMTQQQAAETTRGSSSYSGSRRSDTARKNYQRATLSPDPFKPVSQSRSSGFSRSAFGSGSDGLSRPSANNSSFGNSSTLSGGYQTDAYGLSGSSSTVGPSDWGTDQTDFNQSVTPSRLDTFRNLHDSNGGIQRNDRSSSSWTR